MEVLKYVYYFIEIGFFILKKENKKLLRDEK